MTKIYSRGTENMALIQIATDVWEFWWIVSFLLETNLFLSHMHNNYVSLSLKKKIKKIIIGNRPWFLLSIILGYFKQHQ